MSKRSLIIWFVVLWLVSIAHQTYSQSEGYIYGTVTLKNGQSFQGQIRWDNREAMWNDIFDAAKADRPYQNLLTRAELKKQQNEDDSFTFDFMELWEDRNPDQSFVFRCSFGDMVKLDFQGNKKTVLTLKNGHQIRLKSNNRDLDDGIAVVDKSLGKQEFDFSNISTILFEQTPAGYSSNFGNPIYGKVLTSNGTFEGFITWDQEECLGNDIISGNNDGQLLDLLFKDIKEIKAEKDGSRITLHTGRDLFLNDHDDVDRGNHGITIRGLPFGNLGIEWEHFISATFFKPEVTAPSYQDFGKPSLLRATILTTSGAKLICQIVFDLDEIYDIEFLNGSNGGFDYLIPFAKVIEIVPQNDKFSAVSIVNGEQFLLGDSDDVNIQNNGLILKFSEDRAQFLEWGQVKSIRFE